LRFELSDGKAPFETDECNGSHRNTAPAAKAEKHETEAVAKHPQNWYGLSTIHIY